MESNRYTNYEDIYFYTDSHNDIKLLEFCTIPVAVDPDNILKEISIKNNWKIISLKWFYKLNSFSNFIILEVF